MTEKLYLLGHPIAHSKSPVMHNALYRELGLDWEYLPKDCATQAQARKLLEGSDYIGMNVTTPYKPLAFEMASIKAASAKMARGANVIARTDRALVAYNLDGVGCIDFLEMSGFSFSQATVVVCGTGPTALSILHAAAIAGAKKVVLVGRDKEKTKLVLEEYVKLFGKLAHATIDLPSVREGRRTFREAYDKTVFSYGCYTSATSIFGHADLIVNATPLGMQKGDLSPFDTLLLHEGQTVFDVVYGHGETALVQGAKQQGCVVHEGLGMLVSQAVASAQVFFDIASVDVAMADSDMFAIMAQAAEFE